MTIRPELIDELLKDYRNPQDILAGVANSCQIS
jgi:hypothetical protein